MNKKLESGDDNIPWFPIILSEALEYITHVCDDDARQVVKLPVWARVVMEEEDNIWAA